MRFNVLHEMNTKAALLLICCILVGSCKEKATIQLVAIGPVRDGNGKVIDNSINFEYNLVDPTSISLLVNNKIIESTQINGRGRLRIGLDGGNIQIRQHGLGSGLRE